MSRVIDLTGLRFGRLAVRSRDFSEGRACQQAFWLCSCDCGEIRVLVGAELRKGHTKSCGCYRRDLPKIMNLRHGHSKKPNGAPQISRTYNTWYGMKTRCYNPKAIDYKRYGGRGIGVCDRWRDSFALFLSDMGERPEGRTLDRINPNGNYEPSNCRWATPLEQAATKRSKKTGAKPVQTDIVSS